MAIRIKEIIGTPISELATDHTIEYRVVKLPKKQFIIGFRKDCGIAGYVHNGPPRKDFSQVIEIHKGQEQVVVMTYPKGTCLVVEGY